MRRTVLILALFSAGCASEPEREPAPSKEASAAAEHVPPTDQEEIDRAHRLLLEAQSWFAKAEEEGTSDEERRALYGQCEPNIDEIFTILEPLSEKSESKAGEIEYLPKDLMNTAMLKRMVKIRLKAMGPPPPRKD